VLSLATSLAALPLREVGVVAAAGAVAAAFFLPGARGRALAVLAVLVLTPLLLLADLAGTSALDRLTARPAAAVAAALLAAAAVAVLARAIRRRPILLPALTVAALPFRVPVEAAGESANLLVPLYLVIGAAGLAYASERLRGHAAATSAAERRPSRLEVALICAVVLYALQASYSPDFDKALENSVFFYVPFALLLKLLVAAEWSRRTLVACLWVAVGLALLFAAVGFYEYATRELLLNPKVIEANEFKSYFRVNSLFFDPNIYGRFLAVVMVALATLLLWSRSAGHTRAAGAGLAVLWGGLLLTFSQSSFTALLVGLAVLAALRWRPRLVAGTALVAGVTAAAVLLAFPGLVNVDLGSKSSLDKASSGRLDLMRGGAELFLERPLWGHGSGSFSDRFTDRERTSAERALAASHTVPITIAAEQGLIGLAAFVFVLLAAGGVLFGGLRAGRGPPGTVTLGRIFAAAAFSALLTHTMLYAALLEDPLTWTLLGVALALRVAEREGAPAR